MVKKEETKKERAERLRRHVKNDGENRITYVDEMIPLTKREYKTKFFNVPDHKDQYGRKDHTGHMSSYAYFLWKNKDNLSDEEVDRLRERIFEYKDRGMIPPGTELDKEKTLEGIDAAIMSVRRGIKLSYDEIKKDYKQLNEGSNDARKYKLKEAKMFGKLKDRTSFKGAGDPIRDNEYTTVIENGKKYTGEKAGAIRERIERYEKYGMKLSYKELNEYKQMRKDVRDHWDEIVDLVEHGKKPKKYSELSDKLALTIAVVSGVLALASFSSITGNAIGSDNSTNIGIVFILIALASFGFWIRRKKF
ncbi:MAG: hypothetical protein AABX03_03305 [Nanoarchaeota archaeon]